MLTKGGGVGWFKDLWGFNEGPSYSKNRAMFSMEGDTLVCPSSPFPRQWVGPFSTPSVAELTDQLSTAAPASLNVAGLRFQHLAAPTGIRELACILLTSPASLSHIARSPPA